MEKLRTHYDNLQVVENASIEVIKGAYRYLSQKWHPDKNLDNRVTAERITKIINEAYKVLSDPVQRQQHDDWIKEQREQTKQQSQEPPQTSESLINLNFVYDYDANVQINKIHKFVCEGKTDKEIAEIFTKLKIINMEHNNYIWLDEEIAKIRRNFNLDTSTPLIIAPHQKTQLDWREIPRWAAGGFLGFIAVFIFFGQDWFDFATGLLSIDRDSRWVKLLGFALSANMLTGATWLVSRFSREIRQSWPFEPILPSKSPVIRLLLFISVLQWLLVTVFVFVRVFAP